MNGHDIYSGDDPEIECRVMQLQNHTIEEYHWLAGLELNVQF